MGKELGDQLIWKLLLMSSGFSCTLKAYVVLVVIFFLTDRKEKNSQSLGWELLKNVSIALPERKFPGAIC